MEKKPNNVNNKNKHATIADLRKRYLTLIKQDIDNSFNKGNSISDLRTKYFSLYQKSESFYKKDTNDEKVNVFEPCVAPRVETTVEKPKQVTQKKKYTKLEWVCNLLLLTVILIVSLGTICWFATPITQLGGDVYKEETLNILAFMYTGSNSMFVQFTEVIESFADIDTASAETVLTGVSSIMKIVRLLFLTLPTIIVALTMLVNIISAPIYLFIKNSFKLKKVAIRSVVQNLILYVNFVFFGSISGGVGVDAYFIGYKIGTGMTVCIIVGLAIIFSVIIINFIFNKHKVKEQTIFDWLRSMVSASGYTAISVVLTFMNIYSLFVYVFSSSLTSVLGNVLNGFSITTLIFPVLNFLLLLACTSFAGKAKSGLGNSLLFLLNFGDKTPYVLANVSRDDKKNAPGFIYVIVLSIMALVSVCVLMNPSFGYGWSVDIFLHLIIIFVVAAFAQTVLSFINNLKWYVKGKSKTKQIKKVA